MPTASLETFIYPCGIPPNLRCSEVVFVWMGSVSNGIVDVVEKLADVNGYCVRAGDNPRQHQYDNNDKNYPAHGVLLTERRKWK